MNDEDRMTLIQGDCVKAMRFLPKRSVDAIVTDPPYELGFMGKSWDAAGVAYNIKTWKAAYRVLKPGGHLLAFGGTRTYHRMTTAIEDAGFEIRDCIMWMYGSGFPKSHDISKALDKDDGNWRGRAGGVIHTSFAMSGPQYEVTPKGDPISDLAKQWSGWGTALKPSYEPVVLARKPFKGKVSDNVKRWGTGALNIDETRIGADGGTKRGEQTPYGESGWRSGGEIISLSSGRWPANIALDEEAARMIDAVSGESTSGGDFQRPPSSLWSGVGGGLDNYQLAHGYSDKGGASRFFYTAKTPRAEREFGLSDMEEIRRTDGRMAEHHTAHLDTSSRRNDHPTVKPIDLMEWLCRLITPPGGTVLDPFMGSGSTGVAAMNEGFNFIGIDLDDHYIEISRRRIKRRHKGTFVTAPDRTVHKKGCRWPAMHCVCFKEG